MKLYIKKFVSVLLFAGLLMGILSGCGGSKGGSADYVDALLDVAYSSDDVNDKALDMKKDDIEKAKQECLKKEAQFLEEYFNMENVSDNTQKSFENVAKKLLSKASYTVSDGKDGKVSVTIKPLIVYSEELQEFVDDFNVKKFVDADESCTEEKFVEGIVKILEKTADNPRYSDEIELEAEVKENSGKYEISDSDLAEIDDAMFVYE